MYPAVVKPCSVGRHSVQFLCRLLLGLRNALGLWGRICIAGSQTYHFKRIEEAKQMIMMLGFTPWGQGFMRNPGMSLGNPRMKPALSLYLTRYHRTDECLAAVDKCSRVLQYHTQASNNSLHLED